MDKDQLEKMTKEYQVLQEQLQSLSLQKEQFTVQQGEYKQAAEEVEKSTGKIYLAVGGAMVDVSKERALGDLKEKQESAEMRLSIVSKQYEEASKKEQALRASITSALNELKQA